MAPRSSKAGNASSMGSPNIFQQIQMLRDFTGGNWTDSDYTDCLRQCSFNVERAAECLMTGQYKKNVSGKSTIVRMSLSDQKSSKKSSAGSSQVPTVHDLHGKMVASVTGSGSNQKRGAVRKSNPSAALSKPHGSHVEKLTEPAKVIINDDDPSAMLLCERWISNAICTTRDGKTGYQEPVVVTVSSQKAAVRFRGTNIEGKFPLDVAMFLAPLMRGDVERGRSLVQVTAKSLMAASALPIGAHVPLSVTISVHPEAFFILFKQSQDKKDANCMSFFANRAAAAEMRRGKTTRPLPEAAFDLLQWAEYGNVPHFDSAPEASLNANTDITMATSQEGDDADIEWKEEDENDDNESTMELETPMTSEWSASLPLADEPAGFLNVSLRPYQKQALHWMWEREISGESRAELKERLDLLAELAGTTSQNSSNDIGTSNNPIVCDCGPVQVHQTLRQSHHHPLWKCRYLATPDFQTIQPFYVNELLGVASLVSPQPPEPCSGGILADSMGLGKTVMLMSLILKSKECNDSPDSEVTLVLAKLSLLPQWEEEFKTKTNLTYYVYYGQGQKPTREELQAVDVVLTTYGTIQADFSRENPILLSLPWHRVILDEAHCIRNQRTVASRACCSLQAKHRWCVTGTLMQNSLEDIFGLMKFLKHEPWCHAAFWKAAVTNPMNAAAGATDEKVRQENTKLALDRVRRLLAPIMLRRTKDSLTIDGKPILTLPPKEIKTIHVQLEDTEREFYSAVLARSQDIFEGFVESGKAATSYLQIFGMLQRLRQVCDHIGLTVQSRFDRERKTSKSKAAALKTDDTITDITEGASSEDALGKQFLTGLLDKLCSKQTLPRKRSFDDSDQEKPSKRFSQDQMYFSQVANELSQIVQKNATHLNEECSICLEVPRVEEAVLTPCAHIFCHQCLVSFFRKHKKEDPEHSSLTSLLQFPDGECPNCSEPVQASKIVALSRLEDGTVTSTYLIKDASSTTKPTMMKSNAFVKKEVSKSGDTSDVVRQILEQAVRGAASSKMKAILSELYNVWQLDPGSKV